MGKQSVSVDWVQKMLIADEIFWPNIEFNFCSARSGEVNTGSLYAVQSTARKQASKQAVSNLNIAYLVVMSNFSTWKVVLLIL